MKKFLTTIIFISFVFGLTACNTFSGAGKDIQQGGKAITKAADKGRHARP